MKSQTVQTPDGISWHVETLESEGAPDTEKENIVLIPSGEGDCHNLTALANSLVAFSSRPIAITTFDLPGFSRTNAPKDAYEVVTPDLVARQIVTLLDKLGVARATFFGCSAGGGAVLAVAALFPEHVKCGIVHEVPFAVPPPFPPIREGTDDEIMRTCRQLFQVWIEPENDGKRKWAALGDEYHRRLDKNYVTWMRHLVTSYEPRSRELATKENLTKRPLFWTVGKLSPRQFWELDFELAESVGQKVETDVLVSNHFPTVTVPEDTARWILRCIQNVDSK